MTSWCLARQILCTAFRLTATAGHRRALPVRVCVRAQRSVFPGYRHASTVCAATAAAKLRPNDNSAKNRQIKPPKKAESDSFYAPDTVTFASLGISAAVTASLQNAGFSRPSTVQELSVPVLAAGANAVLAAETGSGKTICYLASVISQLLQLKQDQTPSEHQNRQGVISPGALILCPNPALCNQVKLVADSLTNGQGAPLLNTAHVSNSTPPPFDVPDIVITTPASLINITEAAAYGPEWTKGGVLARMHHIVLDEADLLLSGGFEQQVGKILDAMQQGDKERKAQGVSQELGIAVETFQGLQRHIKAAAYAGGVQGMLDAGYTKPAEQQREPNEDDILEETSTSGRDAVPADRQFQRQYIFVAATLPSEGKKSTAQDLKNRFPELVWLAGNRLHQGVSTVTWKWRETTEDIWRDALLDALNSTAPVEDQTQRALVFANTVSAAKHVAKALENAGVSVLQYHKDVSTRDRAAALESLSKQGGVIVSTDAAARGIDIPNITHVIQADFAASAVDFLHRVGRTARQGQQGQVTSLYSPDRAPLAEAVKAAIEADQPVEGAFSRNRSFSKKFKKYGQYVPRGQGMQNSEG